MCFSCWPTGHGYYVSDNVSAGFPQCGAGRHFINVINLEDEDLLEHLPSRKMASPRPTGPTSPPFSPLPHLTGAPVADPTPTALPNTQEMAVEAMMDAQLGNSNPHSSPSKHLSSSSFSCSYWWSPQPIIYFLLSLWNTC